MQMVRGYESSSEKCHLRHLFLYRYMNFLQTSKTFYFILQIFLCTLKYFFYLAELIFINYLFGFLIIIVLVSVKSMLYNVNMSFAISAQNSLLAAVVLCNMLGLFKILLIWTWVE